MWGLRHRAAWGLDAQQEVIIVAVAVAGALVMVEVVAEVEEVAADWRVL